MLQVVLWNHWSLEVLRLACQENSYVFKIVRSLIFVDFIWSGEIVNVEVVDGGLICSSGVLVEEMGDKNEDCYIVNVAVYVGY